MALALQKCILEKNSQLPTPLKFGSLIFQVSLEMENWILPLWKIGKIVLAPQKRHPRAKLSITDPPKVWVYGFLSVNGNRKLASAIMKNQKNGSSSPKMWPIANLPITDPP